MRYQGQNYEQNVPVPPGPITDATLAAVFERFHTQHEQFYGYRIPGEVIELIHFNVSVVGPVPRSHLPELVERPAPRASATRLVFFRSAGYLPTAIYRRQELGHGARLTGPAIVEETDSTTLIPPGVSATTSPHGILILELASDAHRQSAR
jgi:N-methylhydantoinase A